MHVRGEVCVERFWVVQLRWDRRHVHPVRGGLHVRREWRAAGRVLVHVGVHEPRVGCDGDVHGDVRGVRGLWCRELMRGECGPSSFLQL